MLLLLTKKNTEPDLSLIININITRRKLLTGMKHSSQEKSRGLTPICTNKNTLFTLATVNNIQST